ncbi:ABC transporter permease [Flammeovirga pectinis]|uniref:ABC transporter permease n=1 Tax=Flammeovirga pectinis TaxID=2494373 RepID=A0A3Q9FPH0_9BACT|nr:ABC transporter permease [Flammeovirga pectinis]AZQ64160.1 ABC transporter permease [Flammeovirga pectinis]
MYKIYFNLAIRNLWKNYQNTLINLLGLTLGLGSALFIFLFYHLETNFDNYYNEDIYRVNYKLNWNGKIYNHAHANYPHGANFKEDIDNIEDYAIIDNPFESNSFYLNNENYKGIKMSVTNNHYLHFFNIPLLKGNKETALKNKEDILISSSFAQRFYPNEDPIGKEVEIYGDQFLIKGIFQDQPTNSHLQYDVLTSIEFMKANDYFLGWGGGSVFNLYLKFKHENEIPNSLAKINKILKDKYEEDNYSVVASIQPITDIHLKSSHLEYDVDTSRSYENYWVIISIGIIILALSLLNFTVLYTAQKDEEVQTLSLMKIYGAHQRDILFSTSVEVSLMIAFAVFVSFLGLILILPFLNQQLNTQVQLSNYPLLILLFYFGVGGLLTFLLSYTSLRGVKKSSLVSSLNGNTQLFNSKGRGEKAILILQFAMVFILSFIGLTIYNQHQYLLKKDLGFQHENVLALNLKALRDLPQKELDTFKQEVKKIAGVETVSFSSQMIGLGLTQNGYKIGDSEKFPNCSALFVDTDFLDCFGLKIKDGETFTSNPNINKHQYLVNDAFTKLDGWEGLGTKVQRNEDDFKVVGIVSDFSFNDLTKEEMPLIISTYPYKDWGGFRYINIKYSSANPISFAHKIEDLWKKDHPDIRTQVFFYDNALMNNYNWLQGQQQVGLFFGIITLLIAIAGLWGITRFSVLKRTKEVSLRRVNGATRGQVILLFNKSYLQWILLSFLIAIPIANYFGNDWLSSFPNRISIDYIAWFILGGFIALLSIVTITKICWKVVNTNPSEVLRDL